MKQDAIGGDVRIDSEPGQGMTAGLQVPGVVRPVLRVAAGSPPPATPDEPAGEAAEAGWPEGSTVLVVEDDLLIRMNLAQMTEILGFRPAEAGRAEKALEWLQANPAPALMLTDLSLPGMDGVTLAVEARKIHPRLPVLLVTGHTEAAVKVPPGLRPGLGFLGKPFAMLQLEQAVRALWRQRAAQ